MHHNQCSFYTDKQTKKTKIMPGIHFICCAKIKLLLSFFNFLMLMMLICVRIALKNSLEFSVFFYENFELCNVTLQHAFAETFFFLRIYFHTGSKCTNHKTYRSQPYFFTLKASDWVIGVG